MRDDGKYGREHRRGCGCSQCLPDRPSLRRRCKCGHPLALHGLDGACTVALVDGAVETACGCKSWRPE